MNEGVCLAKFGVNGPEPIYHSETLLRETMESISPKILALLLEGNPTLETAVDCVIPHFNENVASWSIGYTIKDAVKGDDRRGSAVSVSVIVQDGKQSKLYNSVGPLRLRLRQILTQINDEYQLRILPTNDLVKKLETIKPNYQLTYTPKERTPGLDLSRELMNQMKNRLSTVRKSLSITVFDENGVPCRIYYSPDLSAEEVIKSGDVVYHTLGCGVKPENFGGEAVLPLWSFGKSGFIKCFHVIDDESRNKRPVTLSYLVDHQNQRELYDNSMFLSIKTRDISRDMQHHYKDGEKLPIGMMNKIRDFVGDPKYHLKSIGEETIRAIPQKNSVSQK